jgi:hypothetical protein
MATRVRHDVFPAASDARMITVFDPTSRGTDADQLVVPLAVPEEPVLVVQVTAVTPTLSLAVPLIAMEAAEVETVAEAGEAIDSEGGVVSWDGSGGVLWRVTLTDFVTRLVPAVAVIVMVFVPDARGTPAMVQAEAEPWAVPDAPRPFDQTIAMTPVPPDAEPDRLTVEAAVVAGGALTVRVSGAGGGLVGVVRAAYRVSAAFLSIVDSVVTIL